MKTSTSLLSLILLVFAGHAAANPIVFQSDPHGWIAEGNYGTGTNPAEEEGYDVQTWATISMWYPAKAAFRAGRFAGSSLDSSSVGNFSAGFGQNTVAEGQNSLVAGAHSAAIGHNSFAGGVNSIASGTHSIAYGFYATSSGGRSFAFGHGASATGGYSFAAGLSSTASGTASVAFGQSVQANSFTSMAVGRFNVGGGSSTSWVSTDPLFEIGNGTNAANRSNAMTVYKNGDAEFAGEVTIARVPAQGGILMGEFGDSP